MSRAIRAYLRPGEVRKITQGPDHARTATSTRLLSTPGWYVLFYLLIFYLYQAVGWGMRNPLPPKNLSTSSKPPGPR